MADNTKLTLEQTDCAFKELVGKFPKVERLPVDPPLAGQNTALFSFKLLPKPVNGVYGFLKFRGAFANQDEWEKHAKYIIRNIDSKHHIWPFQYGRWMPITTNEEFAQETLSVAQQDDLNEIYNQRETAEQKQQKQLVQDIKARENKLLEESKRKTVDINSLDYYAQQVMKTQQLESWLEQMRQRKRDMLKALRAGKEKIDRLDKDFPLFKGQVDEKIAGIKEQIGLPADAPIDKPSITQTKK